MPGKNKVPESGNWAAVDEAINFRMRELGWSLARLSRESGLSEPTIRDIRKPKERQRSTLVALSASLGCVYGYLEDVLLNRAAPGEPQFTPAEIAFSKNVLSTLQAIDGKVDKLLDRRQKE